MRTVALSDPAVQQKIATHFIPLKIAIAPGTKRFPVRWPAMRGWRTSYFLMGGDECRGITACTVISPDLQVEYANTGSAFVWEMFDSTAYDAQKFTAMLDRAEERAQQERAILANTTLTEDQQQEALLDFRAETRRVIKQEGRFQLPPKGFTAEGAIKLFTLTGDLKE